MIAASVFSLFVLIGNPLIVLAIMGAMGYRKRTGFLAGLTVAQISEFSLIFIAMGVSLGHLREDALGLVTMVGLVTIAASTYMITYSHKLYGLVEPLLSVFERRGTPREPGDQPENRRGAYDVVLFGLGRFGTAIGVRLHRRGLRVLGVDFNPIAVRRGRELVLDATHGDAADPEFVATLPLQGARWVVSSIPGHPTGLTFEETRQTLIQNVRMARFAGSIAATSHSKADTDDLHAAGADIVFEPFQDAADQAVDLLSGSARRERTEIPEIETEEKALS